MARSLARCCAAIIGAAALTFTVIAVASQREARADTPDVMGVGTTDSGALAVYMGQQALWVQVTVLASRDPGAATLLSTDSLTDAAANTWTTNDPVRLPSGTAYGDYPVDVDYRLESGTVQHWSGVEHSTSGGQLNYRLQDRVSHVATDRETTDLTHHTVHVTGSIDIYDPATGTSQPAGAGVEVDARWQPDWAISTPSTQKGVTDSTGSFDLQINTNGAVIGTVTAEPADADTRFAVGASIPTVYALVAPARLTGLPDHVRVRAGSTLTITGTAQYQSATGWRPLPNATVSSGLEGPSGTAYQVDHGLARGTTDSQGRFTYRLKPGRAVDLTTYVVQTYFLRPINTENTQLAYSAPATYTAAFGLDMYARATAHGRIHGACAGAAISLQFSSNGRTGWRTIGTTTGIAGAPNCSYSVSGYGATSGYYRITHAESDQLLAYTGPAKRLSRIVTRIVGFSLSPGRPSLNGKITATGQLQAVHGRSWAGLRGGEVLLLFRPANDTQWYYTRKGHTGTGGSFSLSSPDYGTGDWAVAYIADATHLYSQTGVLHVRVK